MNGQTIAQLWCKITASNDALSQTLCLVNLAVQGAQKNAAAPSPSMDPQTSLVSWLIIAAVVMFCALNIGARVFRRRTVKPRIEPRFCRTLTPALCRDDA